MRFRQKARFIVQCVLLYCFVAPAGIMSASLFLRVPYLFKPQQIAEIAPVLRQLDALWKICVVILFIDVSVVLLRLRWQPERRKFSLWMQWITALAMLCQEETVTESRTA